jgi:starch synthase (maltosyl-transferring)
VGLGPPRQHPAADHRLNQLRRENPALQEYDNLQFHLCDNEQVLFYEKSTPTDLLFVAVSLDPFEGHDVTLFFPMITIGVDEHETWEAEELLTGARHLWRGSHQHVRLEADSPARIWRVRRWTRTEQDFDSW